MRWWSSAVFYHVYPRSFCDSDGDGVGDLEGIVRHLDYLEWLGVDAIWLSPFYPSPMKDFGYDVADYCDVDPVFGSLADFDRLLAEAHGRGLRVIVDWVPNHTSDRHPWFAESRSSPDSPKRDWYIWRDGPPDRPPNNWRAAFTDGPAWTWDRATGRWYLHLFLPSQPDLNWSNPEVQTAMHGTLRFWLDRNVDGFRMDVVHCVGKDPDLPDQPAERAHVPACVLMDHPKAHDLIRGIRSVLGEYSGDRVAVGEILLPTAGVASYYGNGDELHLAFNFSAHRVSWAAATWRREIQGVLAELGPRDAWPTWVLGSHDISRVRTRLGTEGRARVAAVLLLTLRGTPFIYAGDEIGLEDAVIPPDRALDPGGRDGCRAPIPWEPSPGHGWPSRDPWLPWPPGPETRNVRTQAADPGSFLHLYRRLLRARRRSPALQTGGWSPVQAPEGVLAYERRHDQDRRVVFANFTDVPQDAPATGIVEIASDRAGEGRPYGGRLAPDQAVVLELKAE